MATYTLHTLSKAISAKLVGKGDTRVDHLAIDSRLEHPYASTLFIALKGVRNDGHEHLSELYAKGVRNFLVTQADKTLTDASFLIVDDTLLALQQIGAWHRSQFNTPVIGITGSNGKTIVKEWLNELLKEQLHIARSPGSWNSQIGVPMSVWQLAESHTLGLFEAGISRSGEMDKLATIIAPTIGIFTNLGPAHAAGFKGDQQKANEKARLFQTCEQVIFCADDVCIQNALQNQGIDEGKWLTWSRKGAGHVNIIAERIQEGRTELSLESKGMTYELTLPFIDRASIENAMHCLVAAMNSGRPFDEVQQKLRTLKPLAMRLQVLEGVHGSTLVNDAYSNDLASLEIALNQLRSLAGTRSKSIILSDLAEAGSTFDSYKKVQDLLTQTGIDKVYLIGEEIAAHIQLNTCESYVNVADFLARFDERELHHSAVLIKGARTFKLEKIVKRLQAKDHGTILEIDLAAIKHNLDRYRAKLKPSTRVMVMLKAFGYGSGAPELARLLEYEQVDHFGVAYANEGVQLRQEGISTPVLVMNASGVSWDTFVRFDLQPTIHELEQLRSFIGHFSDLDKAPMVHLELDTGMHRLGIESDEIDALITLLKDNPKIQVASIFSHLAGSDSSDHDAFTIGQITLFEQLSERINTVLQTKAILHILNSSGVSRHTSAQLDMVRLGIGLYGYDPAATDLKPALSMYASISQIKRIPAGQSVGYDRSHRKEQDSSIAILPIGYADGLRRSLSNGVGHVWIKGKQAPIVGRVCMDMCMVDVSLIDCQVGDMAILFNETHSLETFAKAMETIPYEVLTSFSQRIERRYSREA